MRRCVEAEVAWRLDFFKLDGKGIMSAAGQGNTVISLDNRMPHGSSFAVARLSMPGAANAVQASWVELFKTGLSQ